MLIQFLNSQLRFSHSRFSHWDLVSWHLVARDSSLHDGKFFCKMCFGYPPKILKWIDTIKGASKTSKNYGEEKMFFCIFFSQFFTVWLKSYNHKQALLFCIWCYSKCCTSLSTKTIKYNGTMHNDTEHDDTIHNNSQHYSRQYM
jgi:hypothetical protein